MKVFFRFLAICLFIFSILESKQKETERKQWEETETQYKKSQETRNTVHGNREGTPYLDTVRGSVLDNDSLERMYDKNYMDYNHHEYNMQDHDEWHDYFND